MKHVGMWMGKGKEKPKIICYAGQFCEANCKIFRVKLSFIGQGKREKRFHFNHFKLTTRFVLRLLKDRG